MGALVAVDVMMMQPSGFGAAEIVPMAINQPSRLATKSIVVFDPAPDIYEPRVSLRLSEVGRGKRSRSPFCLSLRQQDDSARIEDFDFLKLLFVSVAGPANLDCIADFPRRQISTVHESDVSDDVSIHVTQTAQFGPQIGALQDFGLIRLASNSIKRGDPQSDCCDGQDEREQCDRIGRCPFPKSFALLCIVAGLGGGLITSFLLFRIGGI